MNARRVLIACFVLFLVAFAPAASAQSLPPTTEPSPCSGTVDVACTHAPDTPNGTVCFLYVNPAGEGACLVWLGP